MALAAEILEAKDLEAVRRVVDAGDPSDLRETVEPLAAEVLRQMRTDMRRALDVAERASVVADAVEDPRLRARAVWMRAHGLSGVLRTREAAECYEQAADAYREIGDHLQEARVAIGWVSALMYLGDYARALALGEEARSVFVRRGMYPEAARIGMNLGNIHFRTERFAESLRQYDRALRTAEQAGDPVMVRIIQFNRANTLTSLGKMDQAEALYRKVGEGAADVGETRTTGQVEFALGYLELLRGEYGRAYERLEAARTVFEGLDDAYLLTTTLTDLAELFVEMNGFRRAKTFGRQARTMAERHGVRYEAGRSALFEGIASMGLQEHARAATCLEDARRTFELEGNSVAGSLCALYQAELEVRAGKLEAAQRLLQIAVDVFHEERLPLREASARVRLARVLVDRELLAEAKPELQRARRAMRRARSPWLLAQVDHLAGRIAMAQGRHGMASRHFRSAVERVENLRGRIGIDEFRISFGEDKAPVYADLVHSLLARGTEEAMAEAFETVERSKSRALVDLLAGRLEGVREGADPAVARLLARLEKLRSELNWLSGFDSDQSGRRNETRLVRSGPEMLRREEEIADIMQRLMVKDRSLGALTGGETTTLPEVREGLGDVTLVEYYASRHGTLAFVVTRDGARVVELPAGRGRIDSGMSRLRFQIEKWGYGGDYVGARADALRATLDGQLRELGAALWDPLEVDSERVLVVPHGPLHSLPFHALLDRDCRPLAESHVFSCLPSASTRRYLGPSGAPPAGDPRDARILAVGVGDRSIPQVDEEVQRVRRFFRHGRLLRGARATRARFLEEAAEADVVHLATHGVFREEDPHFSALRLADGWMSLYDFYGMKLKPGLVCLSACQSGRSWTGAGDELVGLARGFLHAGARTLVVSLWPVQDESTAKLMAGFYSRLRAGEAAENALRAAMLELREEYPHPYHWAPFVLIGRGGPVAPSAPVSVGRAA